MCNKKLSLFAFLFVLLVAVAAANASVVLITDRNAMNANFWLDWGFQGPPFTQIPQFFSFPNGEGQIQGMFATGPGERRDEGNGWNGNFTVGDQLGWTNANGPLTFFFPNGAQGAGAQIEPNSYGPFTAQIQAFHNDTLLGTFLENGNSQPTEDGSAIFIGIKDQIDEVTSIVFSIVSCTGNCSDFAVNLVSVRGISPVGIPEPASIVLLGSGLLAALGSLRRRGKVS